MSFEAWYEGIGPDWDKKLVIKWTGDNTLNVIGHNAGVFWVSVIARKRNKNEDIMSSNTVDIEVF